MSEYQYYEFQALDRPLSQKQMEELRELSSRADITSTSFVNTYNWGDFRGDPVKVMERYFDAFLYVANWGTHRLMFRFPKELFDAAVAEPYCDGEYVSLHTTKTHVLLDFDAHEEEGGDWEEGEEYLGPLLHLRDELIAGDYRALYFGWLLGVQYHAWEDDELEPEMPPGLNRPSPALEAFADFLRLDPNLLAVAAHRAGGEVPTGPSHEELRAWLAALPLAEKDSLLLRLVEGETPLPRLELLQRFRKEWKARCGSGAKARAAPRRRAAGLREAAEARAEEQQRLKAEKAAVEQARRAAEAAAARTTYLESLVGREKSLWAEIETLIQTKRPKDYDRAVELLVGLRDLAARKGNQAPTETRIREVRARHSSKPSLRKRMDQAGLP